MDQVYEKVVLVQLSCLNFGNSRKTEFSTGNGTEVLESYVLMLSIVVLS